MVFVYFNLHKKCFSVKDLKTGKVIQHTNHINIDQPQFRVQKGGRARVLKEKRKNVHAGVVGEPTRVSLDKYKLILLRGFIASYNPYRGPSFYNCKTKRDVKTAETALMYVEKGKPYVYCI